MTEDKARELILMALGQASLCWEGVSYPIGIFDSKQCSEIGEQLIIDLELRALPDDAQAGTRNKVTLPSGEDNA